MMMILGYSIHTVNEMAQLGDKVLTIAYLNDKELT